MADFIYSAEGRPQGFRLSNHIYAMDGAPVGRVWAEKVYTLAGDYVGAMVNNMVVDKPGLSRRSLAPLALPASETPPRGAENRRPVGETYPDAFSLLTAPAHSEEEPAL